MKKLLGSQLALALVLGLGFSAVSCSPKTETGAPKSESTPAKNNHPIVGKWAQGTNLVITFTPDGKMTSIDDGDTETGEYWVTNGNMLCVNLKGETETLHATMVFTSAKELVLTIEAPKNLPKDMPVPEPQKLTRVSD